MTSFADAPLVLVGGQTRSNGSVGIYMREGYDRCDLPAMIERTRGLVAGNYLIAGDEANPLFSWPVYARVTHA